MKEKLRNIDSIAQMLRARRELTSVLLNLPIDVNETSVASLLGLLDHLAEYPDEYHELRRSKSIEVGLD